MMDLARKFLFGLLAAGALTTAAQPVLAAECKPRELVASLDIKWFFSGLPGIVAKIGDTPEAFLIDTGAVYSAVTRKTVRELKLAVVRSKGVRLQDINGATSNQLVSLPSITIGSMRMTKATFFVLPSESRPFNTTPPEFAGLIGQDFLKNFDVDFDFVASKLNLFSSDHCAGDPVYWTAATVAVLPMEIDAENHIQFRLKLDGKRIDAILDTGSTDTLLRLAEARRRFKVDVDAPDVAKAGAGPSRDNASMYLRRFNTLSFEDVEVTYPYVMLMPDLAAGEGRRSVQFGIGQNSVPAIVGMSVMRRLHVYIAYKERKLYISAPNPPASPATAQ